MGKLTGSVGKLGEDIANDYLEKLGYKIIEENFRCKIGEIDLIAIDGGLIVFVEVKSRFSNSYGFPGEAVSFSKRQKIYKIAQFYISKNKLFNVNCRFDVIEIFFNGVKDTYKVNLIKDAFQS
ncbi:MAG: YraN family protein [Bacillota bacterium]|nr:YraN family protein [Bacillota bacterium]